MFFGFGLPIRPQPPRQIPQNTNPFQGIFNGFNDFLNQSFMHPLFRPQEQQNQVPPQSRPTYTRSANRQHKKESPKKKQNQIYYTDKDGMFWKQKGNQCFHRGQYQNAVNHYTKAIEINDTQSVFFSNRARCLKLLKRFQQAIKDAQTAIELDQKNIKAHLVSGQILAQVGKKQGSIKRIENAITRLTKALTLCSGQKKSHYEKQLNIYIYRAKKLLWYKQFEELRNSRIVAITEYKKYLEQDPNYKQEQVEAKLSEFLKSTNENVVLQIPDYFLCKITLDLMEDPVVTDTGQTYQRSVIEQHIDRNGKTDPFTRQPISGKLYPNIYLKKAIQAFIDKNPWSYQFSEGEDYNKIMF